MPPKRTGSSPTVSTVLARLDHVERMERARDGKHGSAATRLDPATRQQREREAHARLHSGYGSREGGGVAAALGGGSHARIDSTRQHRSNARSPLAIAGGSLAADFHTSDELAESCDEVAPTSILKRPGSRSQSPDARVRFSDDPEPASDVVDVVGVSQLHSAGDHDEPGSTVKAHNVRVHAKAAATSCFGNGTQLGRAHEAAEAWEGNSAEDALGGSRRSPKQHADVRSRISAPQSTGRQGGAPRQGRARDAAESWGGSSLEEVLGGSNGSPKQYDNVHSQVSSAPRRGRAHDAAESWGGSSLEEVLGGSNGSPKQHGNVHHQVSPPPGSTRQLDSAPRRGRARDAAESWGGSSLDEVLSGSKGSQVTRTGLPMPKVKRTAKPDGHLRNKAEVAVEHALLSETEDTRQDVSELPSRSLEEQLSEKTLDIFRRFDTNRNGTIEREELIALLQVLNPGLFGNLGELAPPTAHIMFNTLDRDGSGFIDYEEFIAWVMSSEDPLTMVDTLASSEMGHEQNFDAEVSEQGTACGSLTETAHRVQRQAQQAHEEKIAAAEAEDYEAAKAAKQQEEELLAELKHLQSLMADGVDEGAPLDDAPQSMRPMRSHFGTDPATGTKATRRADEDSWGGVSLGDALGPKNDWKHRYGEVSVQDEAEKYLGGAHQEQPDPWAGVSLDDALGARPKPGAQPDPWAGVSLDDALGARPKAAAQPDPWAGVSLDDALGACPKAAAQPDPWAGVSLDDALGARPKAGAQTDPWAGVSLDDALGARPTAGAQTDPWAGVSLDDALGARPKPAPTRVAQHTSRSPHGDSRSQAANESSSCQKTPTEIIQWLNTLPESHVPEKAREGIIDCIHSQNLDGDSFTQFVQKIDPSICGPKHAMKLKAAWKNVLAEAAAVEVCRNNLDIAENCKKAEVIKIAC